MNITFTEYNPNQGKKRPGNTACVSCKRAHAACNTWRPCDRCVRMKCECISSEKEKDKKQKDTNTHSPETSNVIDMETVSKLLFDPTTPSFDPYSLPSPLSTYLSDPSTSSSSSSSSSSNPSPSNPPLLSPTETQIPPYPFHPPQEIPLTSHPYSDASYPSQITSDPSSYPPLYSSYPHTEVLHPPVDATYPSHSLPETSHYSHSSTPFPSHHPSDPPYPSTYPPYPPADSSHPSHPPPDSSHPAHPPPDSSHPSSPPSDTPLPTSFTFIPTTTHSNGLTVFKADYFPQKITPTPSHTTSSTNSHPSSASSHTTPSTSSHTIPSTSFHTTPFTSSHTTSSTNPHITSSTNPHTTSSTNPYTASPTNPHTTSFTSFHASSDLSTRASTPTVAQTIKENKNASTQEKVDELLELNSRMERMLVSLSRRMDYLQTQVATGAASPNSHMIPATASWKLPSCEMLECNQKFLDLLGYNDLDNSVTTFFQLGACANAMGIVREKIEHSIKYNEPLNQPNHTQSLIVPMWKKNKEVVMLNVSVVICLDAPFPVMTTVLHRLPPNHELRPEQQNVCTKNVMIDMENDD